MVCCPYSTRGREGCDLWLKLFDAPPEMRELVLERIKDGRLCATENPIELNAWLHAVGQRSPDAYKHFVVP